MSGQSTIKLVVFVIDDDDAVRGSLRSLFKSVGLDVEVILHPLTNFLPKERPGTASCLVLDVRAAGH